MPRIPPCVTLMVLLSSGVLVSQSPAPAGRAGKPPTPQNTAQSQSKPADAGMTNADVVKLVRAGLSDDVIAGAIKSATKKSFDLSADGLLALKSAGVSDRVMMAMSGVEAAPAPAPAAAAQAELVSASDPGFYLTSAGKQALLEPSAIAQGKVGTKKMYLTMGLSRAIVKAVVRNANAAVVVSPEVEVLFVAGNGLTHPNEISLVRLTPEEGARSFQIGQARVISGHEFGIRDEDLVKTTFERAGPGTFKILPEKPLEPGEYAFVSFTMMQVAASSVTGKVFDFGVAK